MQLRCAELKTALSQMNEDLGAQCAIYSAGISVYDDTVGKWLQGEYQYRTSEDQSTERSWVNSRSAYYAQLRKFQLFYEKSPITGYNYRFDVRCDRYY
jgi:hypothetical protein